MDRNQLVSLAREFNITEYQLTTDDRKLIQLIQKKQGKTPCYKTDIRYKCEVECMWQNSCKKLTAAWLR